MNIKINTSNFRGLLERVDEMRYANIANPAQREQAHRVIRDRYYRYSFVLVELCMLTRRTKKGVWRMRNRTDFMIKYCFEDVSLFA